MIKRINVLCIALVASFACDEQEAPADAQVEESADGDGPQDVVEPVEPQEAPGTCATLYEHIFYGGDSKEVDDGAEVAWIGGPWNDQVSSLHVRPGCAFNAYEHINYGGAHTSYSGNVPWVGDWWNDRISSYTCAC